MRRIVTGHNEYGKSIDYVKYFCQNVTKRKRSFKDRGVEAYGLYARNQYENIGIVNIAK